MIIDEMLKDGATLFLKDDQESVKDKLLQSVIETTKRQFQKCALYRQFCKKGDFDPRRDLRKIEDFSSIPYFTLDSFKKSGRYQHLLMVPPEEVQWWATSGFGNLPDPNLIGRDRLNIERYYSGLKSVTYDVANLPRDYKWSMFFLPRTPHHTIEEDFTSTVPYYFYLFDGIDIVPFEQRKYCLEITKKGGFKFLYESTIEFLKSYSKDQGPGWISGAFPLMYAYLMDYHDKTNENFDLGDEVYIVSGGGWRSSLRRVDSKEEFRTNLSNVFGIPETNVRDIYNFAETDQFFAECEHYNIHINPWSDVIIRDVETLEPLEHCEKGIVNVINPLAHSYAGISIVTDDIGLIEMEDGCPCGRRGKILKLIGKAEGISSSSCGAKMGKKTE